MTETEPGNEGDIESGTVWDAPNQQVVRPDESHPSEEGEGGTDHAAPKDEREQPREPEPEPEPEPPPTRRRPGRPRKQEDAG